MFEFGAKEANASQLEGNTYVATAGYTRQDLVALCNGDEAQAAELFEHLDWMSPGTLMDEWIEDDEEEC